MKKSMIFAALLFAALLFADPAFAQTPPSDSVTLSWTNPPTYQSGQPLTVGQVSIFIDGVQAAQSGTINTFTTTVLPLGTHTFNVVICDNMTPANCSPMSNTATVTIAPVTLVVPAVSNLTAVVNP